MRKGKISPRERGAAAAALDFVNSVTSSDDAAVGLVPFTHWINIGTGYNGQSWLSVPAPITSMVPK